MTEDTTERLILTLGSDVRLAHGDLVASSRGKQPQGDGPTKGDLGYYSRQLIRSIMAYVEVVTFSMKMGATARCMEKGIEVTDFERFTAIELDSEVDDNGTVIERPAKIRLRPNIRFAFAMFDRANGNAPRFDPTASWWSDLAVTIRVRDRLTHPRKPEDADVSGAEILTALNARAGFEEEVLKRLRKDLPNPEQRC
jgi:hypothetical protein